MCTQLTAVIIASLFQAPASAVKGRKGKDAAAPAGKGRGRPKKQQQEQEGEEEAHDAGKEEAKTKKEGEESWQACSLHIVQLQSGYQIHVQQPAVCLCMPSRRFPRIADTVRNQHLVTHLLSGQPSALFMWHTGMCICNK